MIQSVNEKNMSTNEQPGSRQSSNELAKRSLSKPQTNRDEKERKNKAKNKTPPPQPKLTSPQHTSQYAHNTRHPSSLPVPSPPLPVLSHPRPHHNTAPTPAALEPGPAERTTTTAAAAAVVGGVDAAAAAIAIADTAAGASAPSNSAHPQTTTTGCSLRCSHRWVGSGRRSRRRCLRGGWLGRGWEGG
jgi:hypothetical protein